MPPLNRTAKSNVDGVKIPVSPKMGSLLVHQPKIPFLLYLYRDQLRKREATHLGITYTKMHLTYQLIRKSLRDGTPGCSNDTEIVSRERKYQRSLRREVDRIKQHEAMQEMYNQRQKRLRFEELQMQLLERNRQQEEKNREQQQKQLEEQKLMPPPKSFA